MMRRVMQRSLALPLRKLMAQIRRVEQGDYANTPLVSSGDELQEISMSVNLLASAVQERENSLERARKEEEYLSNHDSLTGLNNRRFFYAAAGSRTRSGATAGVAVGCSVS